MFNALGTQEMLLFGVIALMLFGKRLPEIARKFGGTYRELRGKVDGFQREFRDWEREDDSGASSQKNLPSYDDSDTPKKSEPSTPKFSPPPADEDDD